MRHCCGSGVGNVGDPFWHSMGVAWEGGGIGGFRV